MEPMPKLDPDAFVKAMREKVETMLRKVAGAVNNAPDGAIIPVSERPVCDLFAKLRQETYEMALQMRVNAAEAAFSPSAGRRDRDAPAS
jgi:hypothetical protein